MTRFSALWRESWGFRPTIMTVPSARWRRAVSSPPFRKSVSAASSRYEKLFQGPPRKPEEPLTQTHKDLAASIQKVTERAVLKMCRHLHKSTGERHLCMAGGLVPRSINTVTFVASATASSSRSDDDAMSLCIVEEERQRNRCRPAATPIGKHHRIYGTRHLGKDYGRSSKTKCFRGLSCSAG